MRVPLPFSFVKAPILPVTLYVDQNFEGADTGWFTGGGADHNASTAGLGLEGSQCLQMDAGEYSFYDMGTGYSEAYVKLMFRFTSLPSTFVVFFNFLNAGFTTVAQLALISTGAVTLNISASTGDPTPVALMVPNTTYYVWCRFRKSSGIPNGFGEVSFSTTNSRPTSGDNYASSNTGQTTTDVQLLQPGWAGGAVGTAYIDVIQIGNGYPV